MNAVLFGFDVTVIFDSSIVERFWIKFLNKYGISATIEQVHLFALGVPSAKSIDHFFQMYQK